MNTNSIENDLKKYGGKLPPMKVITAADDSNRSKELDILNTFNERLRVTTNLVLMTCPLSHTHFTSNGKCITCNGSDAENKIRLGLEQLLGMPFTRDGSSGIFINK